MSTCMCLTDTLARRGGLTEWVASMRECVVLLVRLETAMPKIDIAAVPERKGSRDRLALARRHHHLLRHRHDEHFVHKDDTPYSEP